MAMGPSLSARRQAGSQGASQTRPHIELKGLVAEIASRGSDKVFFPDVTYIGRSIGPYGACYLAGCRYKVQIGRIVQ